MIRVPIRAGFAYFRADEVRLIQDCRIFVNNRETGACMILLTNGSNVTSLLQSEQVFDLIRDWYGPSGGKDLPLTPEQQAWWRERLGIQ